MYVLEIVNILFDQLNASFEDLHESLKISTSQISYNTMYNILYVCMYYYCQLLID